MAIKRIHSKGQITYEEYYAAEAGIFPGMLLELNSDGKVIKDTTSGGALGDEVIVALEDYLQGRTVETVYAINEIVLVALPHKGSEVNMLLDDGESVVPGDKIMSGGDGTVKKNAGGTNILGESTGTLDLTASANTANGLTPVRIV